jgi:hypothetical protein
MTLLVWFPKINVANILEHGKYFPFCDYGKKSPYFGASLEK